MFPGIDADELKAVLKKFVVIAPTVDLVPEGEILLCESCAENAALWQLLTDPANPQILCSFCFAFKCVWATKNAEVI